MKFFLIRQIFDLDSGARRHYYLRMRYWFFILLASFGLVEFIASADECSVPSKEYTHFAKAPRGITFQNALISASDCQVNRSGEGSTCNPQFLGNATSTVIDNFVLARIDTGPANGKVPVKYPIKLGSSWVDYYQVNICSDSGNPFCRSPISSQKKRCEKGVRAVLISQQDFNRLNWKTSYSEATGAVGSPATPAGADGGR